MFINAAPKEFLFQAKSRADILGRVWGSFTNPPEIHEVLILLAPPEYAKMESGVDYVLVPKNRPEGYTWRTKGRITIRKER
jgi:hypothetical protein